MEQLCGIAAEAYWRRGWNPIALCPPSHVGVGSEHRLYCKDPKHFGKVPLGRWKYWQDHRISLEELQRQFTNHPNANVALLLGGPVSNLIRVDSDKGEEALRELAKRVELPTTVSFNTARGVGLLYQTPAAIKKSIVADGVEVLGYGEQTVVPPSLHRSGVQYEWRKGRSPEDREPAECPRWILEREEKRTALVHEIVDGGPIEEGVGMGRDRRLFNMACAVRRYGAIGPEILALLQIVDQRCQPPLGAQALERIARSALRYPPRF